MSCRGGIIVGWLGGINLPLRRAPHFLVSKSADGCYAREPSWEPPGDRFAWVVLIIGRWRAGPVGCVSGGEWIMRNGRFAGAACLAVVLLFGATRPAGAGG